MLFFFNQVTKNQALIRLVLVVNSVEEKLQRFILLSASYLVVTTLIFFFPTLFFLSPTVAVLVLLGVIMGFSLECSLCCVRF